MVEVLILSSPASADETAQIVPIAEQASTHKPPPPVTHPVPVRALLPLTLTDIAEPYLITGAGDTLRVYDLSSLDEPEFVREVEGHWHDVTAIRLWIRKSTAEDGKTRVEPWVVSTGLDGTIRKWKLSGKCSRLLFTFFGYSSV